MLTLPLKAKLSKAAKDSDILLHFLNHAQYLARRQWIPLADDKALDNCSTDKGLSSTAWKRRIRQWIIVVSAVIVGIIVIGMCVFFGIQNTLVVQDLFFNTSDAFSEFNATTWILFTSIPLNITLKNPNWFTATVTGLQMESVFVMPGLSYNATSGYTNQSNMHSAIPARSSRTMTVPYAITYAMANMNSDLASTFQDLLLYCGSSPTPDPTVLMEYRMQLIVRGLADHVGMQNITGSRIVNCPHTSGM